MPGDDDASEGGGSGGSSGAVGGTAGAPGGGSGGASKGGSSNGGGSGAGAGLGGTAFGGSSSGGVAGGGGTGVAGATNGGAGATGGASGGAAGAGKGGAAGAGMGGTAGAGKGGAGAGGASTGGTGATGGVTSTCTEQPRTFTANATGQHCGYTYEYWKDAGTGTVVLNTDGFSVDWSNINNLLGRKGIRPGTANLVATYEADYQPNGNSYLGIYGWTRNPLVEYYIIESWGSWRPPGGTALGTVQSDGGTYEVYRTERVNQPSIEGTRTFDQYWSVRTEKRTSGSVTVGNHFNGWATQGMSMGSLYEVSMLVEGYQSSGSADVRMMIR